MVNHGGGLGWTARLRLLTEAFSRLLAWWFHGIADMGVGDAVVSETLWDLCCECQ